MKAPWETLAQLAGASIHETNSETEGRGWVYLCSDVRTCSFCVEMQFTKTKKLAAKLYCWHHGLTFRGNYAK